jgi:hypothetical protein
MRHARVLILLLLLATVLVDLVAVLNAGTEPRPGAPTPFWIAILSLPMSQVCLLAAWAALGNTPAPWRAVGLVIPLAVWSKVTASLLMASIAPAPETITSQWTFFLLMEALAAVCLLGVARAAGLHGTGAAYPAQAEAAASRRPFQFSLGYLFGWLTAAAIVLAGLGYTFSLSQLDLRARDLREMATMAALNVGMLLGALYAMLGTRRWLLRWLVAIVPGAAAAWLSLPREPLWAILVGCTAAWIVGSLAVVRAAGYRLAWRRGGFPAQSPGRAGG